MSNSNDAQHHMIRDAKVEVRAIHSGSGKNQKREAEIIVNDEFVHRFDSKSRISRHLDVMSPQELGERLTGGAFFFIDETGDKATAQLIDHRNGQYMQEGRFVHDDATIAKFMEVLGFMRAADLPLHRRKKGEQDVILRKQWSNGEIEVPGYAEGGEFNSRLAFTWSPFSRTIDTSFDLIRLICSNGAVGLTSFLNNKVPLVNRWEEHLAIASAQIQNKVSSTVIKRVEQMTKERASVGECLLLEKHVFDRLHAGGSKNEGERQRLLLMLSAISPSAHLGNVYKDAAFIDRALAAQLPGHLSHFDLWNMTTELRSHTTAVKDSSDTALDRLANSLMFDMDTNYGSGAASATAPKLSAFSSPDRAFWGMAD